MIIDIYSSMFERFLLHLLMSITALFFFKMAALRNVRIVIEGGLPFLYAYEVTLCQSQREYDTLAKDRLIGTKIYIGKILHWT